jgi:hypothetical protein
MLLELSRTCPNSFENYKCEISLKNEIAKNKIYELKISIRKDLESPNYYYNYPPLLLEAIIVSYLNYLDENKEMRNFSNNVVYISSGIVITTRISYSFKIITKLERI